MTRRPAWLARLAARDRPPSLQWSVVTAAPAGEAKEQWGDTWFARDLVAGLRGRGQRARMVTRSGAQSPDRDSDDVVLVLRGLHQVLPRRDGSATWLLWVISHPDMVEAQEAAAFDAVFAASNHWSRAAALGAQPLLQATNPGRFNPGAAAPDTGADVLFVGSTRGVLRPIVRDALEGGLRPQVFGVGWNGLIDPECIAGDFLANAELPAAYASAHVVLNDHWADMAAEGFLSNRLFDACATGTRVVSDHATGLVDVFGDVVRVVEGPAELARVVEQRAASFVDRPARLELANRIAQDHSFDARAASLIESVRRLRGGT